MNRSVTYIKTCKFCKGSHYNYKRVIGCAVDIESDYDGYFIESDGSRISTSQLNAARILLFSRLLASQSMNKHTFNTKIHHYVYKFALWALFDIWE